VTLPDDLGTVFISYTQDSPEHADKVLALSNKLRDDGIDCVIDQYELSPPEGWPLWMDREIKKAKFVLMICTAAYLRRVNGDEEPGIGLGIAWEGNLICNHIYNTASRNTKFIPVVFDAAHAIYVPTPIQGVTRYNLGAPDGYERLYSRLIGKPLAEKPPLGKRKSLPQLAVRTTFSYSSSTVATLTKLDLNLREAMDYLQAMARAAKFEGEVSDEVYARLSNAAADSARATLAEGRLFIPQQIVEQCERFLGCLLQGLLNHGNARREHIIDGHQRAAFWNKAGDIAYKKLPMILKEFETAARGLINNDSRSS
jgi:SEFIR domain